MSNIILTSCDNLKNESDTIVNNYETKLSDYENIVEQMIVNGNFAVSIPVSGHSEKLIFYISDQHCLDCVLKHLKFLATEIETGRIKTDQIILIADYFDKKMLKSQLIRANLESLVFIEMKAQQIFKSQDQLYDLPSFFIYNPKLKIGNSLYQATLGKENLSKLIIQSYSNRF